MGCGDEASFLTGWRLILIFVLVITYITETHDYIEYDAVWEARLCSQVALLTVCLLPRHPACPPVHPPCGGSVAVGAGPADRATKGTFAVSLHT